MVKLLPGALGALAIVAGATLAFGVAVGLVVAGAFLLLADRRM